MKCYSIEFSNGSPDTEELFIFAESAEEAAAALNEYGDDVEAGDLSEIDSNCRYFKSWAKKSNTYYVVGGELTRPGMYDNERDFRIDMEIDRAEREGRML